jgi:hypothetical protein
LALAALLIPAGRLPIFRILPGYIRVVIGRGVVKIHLDGWRSPQRVNRDAARRWF